MESSRPSFTHKRVFPDFFRDANLCRCVCFLSVLDRNVRNIGKYFPISVLKRQNTEICKVNLFLEI